MKDIKTYADNKKKKRKNLGLERYKDVSEDKKRLAEYRKTYYKKRKTLKQ